MKYLEAQALKAGHGPPENKAAFPPVTVEEAVAEVVEPSEGEAEEAQAESAPPPTPRRRKRRT